MARITPISGFPEWLPEQRMVEQRIIDTLRDVFELHGFASIETRAVEPVQQLLRKGEIDKEVYAIRRLAADAGEDADPAKALALHFDLTVPFARYVLENAGKLTFPFRRYQIQKVWRGERPQEGRYREFCQADIDIVNVDELDFSYDIEVALVMAAAYQRLQELGLPQVTLHTNNRKLSQGFYEGLDFEDTASVLRVVDKLDKIGPAKVAELLVRDVGASQTQAEACIKLAQIKTLDTSFAEQVAALGVSNDLLDEGLHELATVIDAVEKTSPGFIKADLSIARGLDYYTGTVCESFMTGYENLGAVGAGGRYEKLASDGKKAYPGVGLSFGISRTLGPLFAEGLRADRSTPVPVMIAVTSDDTRAAALQKAAVLRGRGIGCIVSPNAAKFGKQIKQADKRGIPFVWFPGDDGGCDQVKDIRSGDQVDADVDTWSPAPADMNPQLVWPDAGGSDRG